MKALEEFKVSVYKCNNSVENVSNDLIGIVRAIILGEWKDKVLTIRRYMAEGDMKAANALKAELPCFVVTGVFNGSHAAKNLVTPTELVILDFDHPADLTALRTLCNADSHTVTSFQSPRDGLKVIVHVEGAAERHAEAYALARTYYENLTGMPIDDSGKDLSRTCLVSYDPEGYLATLYDSFVLPAPLAPLTPVIPPVTPSLPPAISYAGQEKKFISSYIFFNPIVKGKRHATVVKLAFKAAETNCDVTAIYSILRPMICDETFTDTELKSTLSSVYQKFTEKETEISPKNSNPHATAIPPSRQYMFSADDENAEEAYQEGEEQRKKTLCFPSEMYENLPTFMNDCLENDLSLRERDVRLLACLATFSTLLPATWGKYNHSRYTPHLYTWVIAPAASGKGAAVPACRLLDVTNEVIKHQSDAAMKKYEREMHQWKIEYARKHKQTETKEATEEPEEPPYRILSIPSTTSNSRLIRQLHDNADLGGIIFDTEAQTLTDNNKQDYGHLDSLLCKAFGHETISSSFFIHGKKPVECRHPALAIFISCTTTQVSSFIENADSGLMSRFLTYTYRTLPQWKDMSGEGEDLNEHFEQLSQKAYALFRFCTEHPMLFYFSRKQWDTLNHKFSSLLEKTYLEDREELFATVKRYAFCVMRVAMILTRLEQFDRQDTTHTGECPERFFQVALSVVLCCFEHSRLLLTGISQPRQCTLKDPNKQVFPLKALPDTFTYAEAMEAAEKQGMPRRTAERIMRKLIDLKIRKISKGIYQKLSKENI